MWFAFWAEDRPGGNAERSRWRPDHLARLTALLQDGRLLSAGPLLAWTTPEPHPDAVVGSLVIADFESLEDAQHWIKEDPYQRAGIYQSVHVHPFVVTCPPAESRT
ncbi:YCII-related domain-like protein [mine drainage metagenome]|uniref:YCII-related domain-like protein n=1 Tax=mine drainage metagenome TaxID=410659 RepID=T1B4M3_9ZZZZ